MNIVVINGSPKVKRSASAEIIRELNSYLESEEEIINLALHSSKITDEQIKIISNADSIIFVYPLYVDGVPGHLLSCLEKLEKVTYNKSEIRVYGIVNCGFYEGIQNEIALNVLENWAIKCGHVYSGGIGIGGGGSLPSMASLKVKFGPKLHVYKSLEKLSKSILNRKEQSNDYISVVLTRPIYQFAAQHSWRKSIKSNGKNIKDLNTRP